MSEGFGLEQSDRLASLVMTETAAAASTAIVITSIIHCQRKSSQVRTFKIRESLFDSIMNHVNKKLKSLWEKYTQAQQQNISAQLRYGGMAALREGKIILRLSQYVSIIECYLWHLNEL